MNEEQIERYSRHIILPEMGGEGQERLLAGKVFIVGAGGLGSPAALYLAAAGVGTIGLADGDDVELSNLQRQILHATSDVGSPKVVSALERMHAINPDINIRVHKNRITAQNALEILKDYQFVIDGTDNFSSKFLIADACHFAETPYSHAGVLGFGGQMITVLPGQTACYRCVFNAPPPPGAVPSCSQAGVLGVVPGAIGVLQACEAIKSVLGVGELMTNRLLVYNALKGSFRTVQVKRSERCPLCGENPTVAELQDGDGAACDLKGNGE